MKREIKFRGKRSKDDEWVYGGLVYRLPKHPEIIVNEYITHQNGECEDNFVFYQDIYEDTVGQFTGLHDRNGEEIYEGDIVNFDDSPYSVYAHLYTGKVVFYKGQFCVEHYEDCFTTTFYTPLFKDDFADKKTTVLGNIYDNPELLK